MTQALKLHVVVTDVVTNYLLSILFFHIYKFGFDFDSRYNINSQNGYIRKRRVSSGKKYKKPHFSYVGVTFSGISWGVCILLVLQLLQATFAVIITGPFPDYTPIVHQLKGRLILP